MLFSENSEVRKIQYTGRSTYILSIPKKWISEMHLHAGDSVTIVREANHSLSIFPKWLSMQTMRWAGTLAAGTAVPLA